MAQNIAQPGSAEEQDLVAIQRRDAGIQKPVALQDPFPDQRDDHGGQQDRKEIDGAEEAASADLHVEHDGRQERQPHHRDNLEQGEPERVEDAAPEMVLAAGARIHIGAAVEQIGILASPDVGALGRKQRRPAGDRIDEVDADRHEHEQAEEHKVRQQEDVRHPPLADEALQARHRPVDDPRGQSQDRVRPARLSAAACRIGRRRRRGL